MNLQWKFCKPCFRTRKRATAALAVAEGAAPSFYLVHRRTSQLAVHHRTVRLILGMDRCFFLPICLRLILDLAREKKGKKRKLDTKIERKSHRRSIDCFFYLLLAPNSPTSRTLHSRDGTKSMAKCATSNITYRNNHFNLLRVPRFLRTHQSKRVGFWAEWIVESCGKETLFLFPFTALVCKTIPTRRKKVERKIKKGW